MRYAGATPRNASATHATRPTGSSPRRTSMTLRRMKAFSRGSQSRIVPPRDQASHSPAASVIPSSLRMRSFASSVSMVPAPEAGPSTHELSASRACRFGARPRDLDNRVEHAKSSHGKLRFPSAILLLQWHVLRRGSLEWRTFSPIDLMAIGSSFHGLVPIAKEPADLRY